MTTAAAAAVVMLFLQPVLTEDGPLRLVAADVGDSEVTWSLDGVDVARSGDREAVVIDAMAGEHDLRATSTARGAWQAMARPDGAAAGAAFVPAWSATHEPEPEEGAGHRSPVPPLPLALGLVAAVLLAWPRRMAWPKTWRAGARRPAGRRTQRP